MKALSLWQPAKRPVDDESIGLILKYCPEVLGLCDFGCIVAVVELSECVPTDDFHGSTPAVITQTESELGNYDRGRFAWVTVNRRQIREALPMRGRQGLWPLSDGEIQAINERL